jgi:hypothetical protein
MSNSTLHIVFSGSAAGLLRQALKKIDQSERVLSFDDNLGLAPSIRPIPTSGSIG